MAIMAKSKKITKSEKLKKIPPTIKKKQKESKLKLYQKDGNKSIKKSKEALVNDIKKLDFEISNKSVEKKSKIDKILNHKSLKEYTKEAKKKILDHHLSKLNQKKSQKSHKAVKIISDSLNLDIKKKSKKVKKLSEEKFTNSSEAPVDTTCDLKMESSVNDSCESAGLLHVEKDGCDEDNTLSSLPQVGFIWGENMEDLNRLLPVVQEDSEEDDDEVKVTKAKPKLTKAERAASAKAEEAMVRAAEDELLQNGDPVSPDGFDRMLLAQPDCSELWVKYMAYHLQATEIEKARAVARRALTIINIRREEDRLNVWTALMNLEHLYGTRDSLQSCVHEALRCNDEVKVYTNLMNIYATSGQIRDLDSTVKLLLKKAGTGHTSVNVYLQCANTLLQHGQKDTARHILQRGLNNLPPAVHVTLISRFALAENKHGDSARAQALFEHTLTSYPTRVDVWGVYVDMLVKSDRVDLARQVIQRAVTQKLPPKKLKPLYMKWLKLEEQYGDAEAVENVKKEIEQYVKNTRGKLNHVKLAL